MGKRSTLRAPLMLRIICLLGGIMGLVVIVSIATLNVWEHWHDNRNQGEFVKVTEIVSIRDKREVSSPSSDDTSNLPSQYPNYALLTPTQESNWTDAWKICAWERDHGSIVLWIVIHSIAILYAFTAIALICDDYFVPVLDIIAESLNIPDSVNGATFMAAGSSAPELFTSLVGVAQDSPEVGVGTITGSAVFNLLVILAGTALFTPIPLQLDWRPLARDSAFYSLSIILFISVAWDARIYPVESVLLLTMYLLYIIVMMFDKPTMKVLEYLHRSVAKLGSLPNDQREELPEVSRTGLNNIPVVSWRQMSIAEGEQTVVHNIEINSELHVHTNHIGLGEETREVNGRGENDQEADSEDESFTLIDCMPPVLLTFPSMPRSLRTPLTDTTFLVESEEIMLPPETSSSTRKLPQESMRISNLAKNGKEEVVPINGLNDPLADITLHHPASNREEEKTNSTSVQVALQSDSSVKLSSGSLCHRLVYTVSWFKFLLLLPLCVSFAWTIPHKKLIYTKTIAGCKFLLPVAFLICLFWISIYSYGMVYSVRHLGCLIKVPAFLMSLVILAAGTSIPDLLSSIIVAKQGKGDEAVSNAIGSNVFDIDLGLGLPFFLYFCIIGFKAPLELLDPEEYRAHFDGGKHPMTQHVKFGLLLLFILLLTMIALGCTGFKLNKKISCFLLLLYVTFITYGLVQDSAVCGHGYSC